MFLLELPHRSDSNEYTQHNIINIKKEITLKYHPSIIISAAKGFFLGTQEQAQYSRDKRAIGVQAIEVLLYM